MSTRPVWSRAAGLLGLLLAVSFLAFLLPQLTGADPVRSVIRARTAEAVPDQATVDRLAGELGLDRPLPQRYVSFVGDLLTGDLGVSYTSRTPVAPQLTRALGVSLLLVGSAMTIALVGGLLAGTLSAARRDGPVDRLVTAACRLVVSVPEFVSGPLLVLLFAIRLDAVPATGWGSVSQAVLPITTVALLPMALFTQLFRTELLEQLTRPWVRLARANGLRRRTILTHALRSSSGSAAGLASLFLPGLLGGAVIVEVVFAVPGLGRLLYSAILESDLPVAQAGVIVLVALTIIVSLVSDLVRYALDPTLRDGVTA